MDLFSIITILVVLSAVFGYINTRFLKLPNTIGLMLLALLFSLVMILLSYFFPQLFDFAETLINRINFSEVIIHVMLSFLLFAGAMHTDLSLLRAERRSIILFSLVGVAFSTLIISALLFYILQALHTPASYINCLLFGALISPTDPIAVLGILTKTNVPKRIEINIVGESLFNDGVGVVIFLSILQVLRKGAEEFSAGDMGLLLVQEAIGGIAFGLLLGYAMYFLLRTIDNYETEVMITLAGVMGGYLLANAIHVSGPLAMVVSGLFTGSRSKTHAMSETTELYTDKFWELIDILMNAILFVLIGLRLVVMKFNSNYLLIGLITIPAVLLARYLSLRIPLLISRRWVDIDRKSVIVMTWGGLRGGLSIAMALSLERGETKDMLVYITYIIVLFSIIVQGLTVEKLAKRLYKASNN